MKVLWIINTIFPYPSEQLKIKPTVYGGWLLGLFNELKNRDNIELSIASVYKGNKFLKYENDSINYYLLPCNNNSKYDKNLEKYWKNVVLEYKPDLVHIHGTEYVHALAFQKACPNVKNIVSIQGLISVYANYYLSNINYNEIKKCITLRNFIKGSIFKEQKAFFKKGVYEKKIIRNADAIVGRTNWDYANSIAISKKDIYYKCNENLRDSFYDKCWDYRNIRKNSIFVSSANYSIKGFHIMIEALKILKDKYPDIKVYVAGTNLMDKSTLISKIKYSDYQKYLYKQIKRFNLIKYIEFTGPLNESQMTKMMLKSNVYVQTSSIENSSNALGEAMILGLPVVASNVGGTGELLIDKKEGYLYPFGDYGQLAYYISKVFDDSKESIELGLNAKKHAERTHNKQENVNDLIEIYTSITHKRI